MRRRGGHTEWLSLLDVSGPFLTLAVLDRVFPDGLPPLEPYLRGRVRGCFEEWEEGRDDAGIHNAWIRFLLTEALEYPEECLLQDQRIPAALSVAAPAGAEQIAPSLVLADPEVPGAPRLPLLRFPPGQKLDLPLPGAAWVASPHARMQHLLQATGLRAGFVTNGGAWSLVHARPGEATGYITWHTSLLAEEPLYLAAFRAVLGAARVYGAPPGETLFELLDESAANQEEVTRELGRQVRQAVEVFINALERLDREADRRLLADVSPQAAYDAALTVMMRLVFLLSAEQNGLLPRGDLYDRNYSVSNLGDSLRRAAAAQGEEVLEHRHDAWRRLLALFRLIHRGCLHPDLNLPQMGGSLFDPDRYPFLEGEGPERDPPLAVSNRVVLHLLDALEFLEIALGPNRRERRRLSFRSLGVEEIGHVYEGLLDHTAKRAAEPTLGMVGKEAEEPEAPLADIEGAADRIVVLAGLTGRSEGAIRKLLEGEPDPRRLEHLRALCGDEDGLFRRVAPLVNVIRDDSLGRPQLFPAEALFMTAGQDRRSTGTHYTPAALTEEIVRYALEPLVYEGPAEGAPRESWALRSPREILSLKVCDPAMGSGAFLVQSCRYLAERLVESWASAAAGGPASPAAARLAEEGVAVREIRVAPAGEPALPELSERVLPDDPEERIIVARRLVADHCLYGVDRNPMAVEMAKLSLWLLTLARGRPLTFLDHRLRCGDSLAGTIWSEPRPGAMRPLPADLPDRFFAKAARRALNARERGSQRALFFDEEAAPTEEAAKAYEALAEFPDTPEGQEEKARSYRSLARRDEARRLRVAADLWSAAWFWPEPAPPGAELPTTAAYLALLDGREPLSPAVLAQAEQVRARLGFFHWALEFPDACARGGFDAVVGNPPFQGGQKITGVLGTAYREYLVHGLAGGARGSADLCAYFFLRAAALLRREGCFGLLATNTIAQGDTREVGLDRILGDGRSHDPAAGSRREDGAPGASEFTLTRAHSSRPWPGTAHLSVAVVWGRRGTWRGERVLDGRPVPGITAYLTPPGAAVGKPYRLAANAGKSFQGSIVLGMGFVLTPSQAAALIERDARNADVLFPYLNGEDLNSRPDQSPSRWVINFRDWPLERGAPGSWDAADERHRKEWLRAGRVPGDYPDPVAADYPDCLAIIERLVRPERERNNRKVYRDRWWHYGEKRPDLYAAIAGLERVLAVPLVSKHLILTWSPEMIVFSHALGVVATSEASRLALLQSTVHEEWARRCGSSLETRMRYTPSDCFETFPFPECLGQVEQVVPRKALERVGQSYYEHRRTVMLARQEGLTKTYNRFHDPRETSEEIRRLRELHVEMDAAVLAAYGWTDPHPGHGFHETRQGLRFTFHPAARQSVLDRLLLLNHERHAAEESAGSAAGPVTQRRPS